MSMSQCSTLFRYSWHTCNALSIIEVSTLWPACCLRSLFRPTNEGRCVNKFLSNVGMSVLVCVIPWDLASYTSPVLSHSESPPYFSKTYRSRLVHAVLRKSSVKKGNKIHFFQRIKPDNITGSIQQVQSKDRATHEQLQRTYVTIIPLSNTFNPRLLQEDGAVHVV